MAKHTRPPRIIIADDDTIQLTPFLSELQFRGCDVRMFAEADSCRSFARRKAVADIFVIDVMLASDSVYRRDDTDNYLLTGLLLARDIRAARPSVPIVLFSNMTLSHYIKRIERFEDGISNCTFLSKREFSSPFEFAETILRFAASQSVGNSKPSLWERVVDAVELKPNISGIGIDLKKLGGNRDT